MLTLPIHKVINQYSKEIGFKFKESKVLDIGCGSGDAVKEMLEFGIETYGVDISFKPGQNLELLISNGNLKLINLDNYKIPFQDNYFDIIYADQVLEHVQDLNSFIDEVFRVLKPNGFFVAYFPSKYKPVEPHVGIPFGGFFRPILYLYICVFIGAYYIQKSSKSDSKGEKVSKIRAYLDYNTCYRTKCDLHNAFSQKFSTVKYREDLLLDSFSRKSAKLISSIPFGIKIFGLIWSHLLIAQKSS